MPTQPCLPASVRSGRAWRAVPAVLCVLVWLGMATPRHLHAQPTSQQAAPPSWQPLGGPGGSIGQLAAEAGTTNLYAAIDIRAADVDAVAAEKLRR